MISARLSVALAACCLCGATQASAMNLSEALQLALQHDPEIRESLATYQADLEAGKQETSGLLPSIGLSAKANEARTDSSGIFGSTSETYPEWSAGLEARQALFRLDWFARGDRADARDALAEARAASRRLQSLRKVAERYFAVLVAQEGVAQAKAEAAAVRESLEDTRKRYDVQLVAGNDLKEAQARDDVAQAQILSAEHELASARDGLREITATQDLVLPSLRREVTFPPLMPMDADSWVKAASGNNPDVLAARQQLEIARADVTSRRSEASPTLDLVATAARQDSSEFSFGQRVDDGRIGLELKVPIYAGGINASRVREASAREVAAEAALQRVSQQVEREARQRFRNVTSDLAQLNAKQNVLASSRLAETAVRNGYDAGTRTITDVLDARSRVVQSTLDLNRTRLGLVLNLLELRMITGGLSEKDFAEVDRLLDVAAQATDAASEEIKEQVKE